MVLLVLWCVAGYVVDDAGLVEVVCARERLAHLANLDESDQSA